MSVRIFTFVALTMYVALAAIDFIDTYLLIRRGDGSVYESNPVAATWLKDYGWKGLAVFKVLATSLVVSCVLIIRPRRPRTAAVLATAACIALLSVTLYSRKLLAADS
jgi:Domain of unknown function (DUF5658)